MMLDTKSFLLELAEQMVEKYCDPVHPPIDNLTRFPDA